jgi:hypothetical protein
MTGKYISQDNYKNEEKHVYLHTAKKLMVTAVTVLINYSNNVNTQIYTRFH